MSDVRPGDFVSPSIEEWVDESALVAFVGAPAVPRLLAHNPVNAVTGGIWRVKGPIGSIIVKVVTDGRHHDGPSWWAASQEDRHWNSWRREVLVYREHLAAALAPDRVGAPALIASDDARDGAVVLWLEDVHGRNGSDLRVADLVDLAHALGRAQGRLTQPRVIGIDRGSSRHFLREYSASKPVDDALLADDDAWRHPRVARHLGELRDGIMQLRTQRTRLVDLGEGCPQTLCHLDLWPPNVVRREDGRFALLDWAFAGSGALGEDIANLVPDAVFDLLLPASRVEMLATAAEDAYLDGVRLGGWQGDERWIRLGIRAASVKYAWLAERLLVDPDLETRTAYGGRSVPADELYAARAAGLRVLCRWAEEAFALAEELGLGQGRPGK